MRRRTTLYVLLALAVPLPAFALTAGGEPAPASLSVSASLDGCGIGGDAVMCSIDASWNQLEGATRYTASVTGPDGSVVDFGDVGAGSESFYVPYAGNGTYTVTVTAYGIPPDATVPEVIAKDSSGAGGEDPESDGGPSGQEVPDDTEPADAGEVTDPGQEPKEPPCEPQPIPGPDSEPEAEAGADETSTTTTTTSTTTTTTPTEPTCPPAE